MIVTVLDKTGMCIGICIGVRIGICIGICIGAILAYMGPYTSGIFN